MPKVISAEFQLFTRKQFKIFKILGRNGRIEVLAFLLRNPKEEFTIRDIARASNTPTMTVSRCIKEFDKLAMIRKRSIGKAFAISLFPDSPAVELIKNIAECCRYE